MFHQDVDAGPRKANDWRRGSACQHSECSTAAASLSLYNAENAKGTDPADIFDKLIALVDAQPEDFRSFIDWEAKTA